jgi:hypothetical protein
MKPIQDPTPIQDTTSYPRTSTSFGDASASEEPWSDLDDASDMDELTEADAVAFVPTVPIEAIKRKYGPDILRPASQFPCKAAEHPATDYSAAEHPAEHRASGPS